VSARLFTSVQLYTFTKERKQNLMCMVFTKSTRTHTHTQKKKVFRKITNFQLEQIFRKCISKALK